MLIRYRAAGARRDKETQLYTVKLRVSESRSLLCLVGVRGLLGGQQLQRHLLQASNLQTAIQFRDPMMTEGRPSIIDVP